ncbi:MAG: hypothetical protein GY928_17240 [Colwellia sp.]|nr:hypothetical protein [Colwellia sp.]
MLDGLIKFSNALCNALPKLYGLYKQRKHDEKIVELFECFFIMGDLVETADELLNLARGKDEIILSELPREELEKHYVLVQTKLTIQLQRHQRLGDIFLSNPTIDLLDTDIKDELKRAIGGKEHGLYALGASLLFNQIFGNASKECETEDNRIVRVVKEKYDFASSISGMEKISVEVQRELVTEINSLRKRYRDVLDNLTEAEHKTLLASKAKEFAEKYSVRF